jgi:hypothetical protein
MIFGPFEKIDILWGGTPPTQTEHKHAHTFLNQNRMVQKHKHHYPTIISSLSTRRVSEKYNKLLEASSTAPER